jgi:S-adenosylmethionine decarboxylase
MKRATNTSSHHLGTIYTSNKLKLHDCQGFLDFLHPLFESYDVKNLGVLSHIFENGSFSLVVMLAESHISVHTWPEKKCIQLDVFLCNYEKDNSSTGKALFDTIVAFFEPNDQYLSTIERL